MNKIYKVIWSKTRNCYVAVSEIARNHGKDSVRSEKRGMFKGTFALALCIALSLGVTGSVWAAEGETIIGKYINIYGISNRGNQIYADESAAAIGRENMLYGSLSLAVGHGNWVGIDNNTAPEWINDIPTTSTWNGFSSLAVGSGNVVRGGYSAAIGETVRATGDYSFAQGVGSRGGGTYFPGTTAYGMAASAFNVGTLASGEGSTSHGYRTVAGGRYSAAFGDRAYAKGTGSFAVGTIGYNSIVNSSITNIQEYYNNREENEANYRFYIPDLAVNDGYHPYFKNRPQTTAVGSYSAAFGAGAVAVGETSFTAGTGTTALGDYSVAFGSNSLARGDSSFAVGHSTYAVGNSSVAFNDSNFAIGYASAAFGNGTRAEGMRSVAMGNGTRAEGINAVAFGYDNTAGGQNSLAFGMGNKAYASRSVAFGSGTQAGAVEYDENGNPVFTYDYDGTKRYAVRGGEDSLAYGLNTKAFGDRSTASGTGTFASGEVSIASGNMTRALGQASSAGGSYTAAYGQNATSFGEYAHAIGKNTTAFGHYTTAGKRLQTEEEKALGIYTMVDPYTGEQTKVTKVNKLQYASMLTDANGNVVTDNDPNHLVDSVDRNYIIYHAKRSKNTSLYAIRVPIKDENGNPTGEYKIREVYQKPGDDTWYIYTEEEQAQREQDAGGKPTLLVNYDGVFVNDTSVKADNAVAFGNDTEAAAENALAFGDATLASNKRATAFGNHTVATGDSATSFGDTTLAAGRNATAFGESTVGTMQNATAFGQESAALAKNATAFGVRSKALGQASTTWGDESIAPGKYSTAFGEDSEAFAQDSAAWGSKTVAGVDKNDQAYKDYKDKLTEIREKENQLKLLKKNGVTADIVDADGNVETKGSISLEAEIREDEAALNTLYAKMKNLGKAATAFGENTNAIGTGSTAWGSKSVATGKYSTAFGESSKAYGQNSIAGLGGTTGTESTNATGAIAIGKGAVAQEANNIALGQKAKALGADSIVIGAVIDGKGSTVNGSNSIAIGSGHTVSGNNSGAFGDPDVIEGDNSYIIGNNSSISVDDAFVLGNSASVTANGGVALGTGSVASRGAESKTVDNTLENSIYGYDMKEKKAHVLNPGENESVWAPTAAAVSVGDTENNITRRITGVAAGSADTDAVNVAQLRAFVGESSSGGDGVHYYSTPEPTIEHEANYNNDGATGTYAMAAGVNTTATGNYATAIGGNAQANGEGNTVLGSSISVNGKYNTVAGTGNNIHNTTSSSPERNTAVGTQNEINITRHLLLDFEGQPRKRLENSGNPFITKDSGVFLFPFSRKVSDI